MLRVPYHRLQNYKGNAMDNKIRAQFPYLKNDTSSIYLDSAATSQKPQKVLDALVDFYTRFSAPVHRGIYQRAENATTMYEQARAIVALFIGADVHEVVFTNNATDALNRVAFGFALKNLKPGDEIVVTELEHHANLLPWQQVAQLTGAQLKFIPVTLEGDLDYSALRLLITPATKLVACTAVSNALGTVVDVPRIIQHAHAVHAVVVVDATQLVPHTPINVHELDADFLVFSGHKMLGPTGIGVLYAKHTMHEQLSPVTFGGGMVFDATYTDARWRTMPYKLEAGTPPIAQAIGLAAAVNYLQELDRRALARYSAQLCEYLISELALLPAFRIIGPQEQLRKQGHLVSFVHESLHAHDIAAYLDTKNIAVRAGNHCAQPLHKKLAIDATVRASFYVYSTQTEVEHLIKALKLL